MPPPGYTFGPGGQPQYPVFPPGGPPQYPAHGVAQPGPGVPRCSGVQPGHPVPAPCPPAACPSTLSFPQGSGQGPEGGPCTQCSPRGTPSRRTLSSGEVDGRPAAPRSLSAIHRLVSHRPTPHSPPLSRLHCRGGNLAGSVVLCFLTFLCSVSFKNSFKGVGECRQTSFAHGTTFLY